MNETKTHYALNHYNHQAPRIDGPEPELRRPIFKTLKFFGLKTRKWAAFSHDELLIFKTRKSQQARKKLSLKDTTPTFPPDQKLNEKQKTSTYTVKLIHLNKQTYWLQPINLQDYWFIKSKFIEILQQKAGIDKSLSIQPSHQTTLTHKQEAEQKEAFVQSNQKTRNEKEAAESDSELNFNEEDVIEINQLENTINFNMSFYCKPQLHRKFTLEERFNVESQKNLKFYNTYASRHFDEMSEGPRDFNLPLSSIDISNLKTKRATDRSFIDVFSKQESFKSQISGNRFEASKFFHSNTMNLPRSFEIVQEQFDDEIEEQFARRKGKKRDFLESDPSQDIIIPMPKVSEMIDSNHSAPLNKEYASDDEALKADENAILKTLSYAREAREIKDEYKVFKRMRSKKEANLNRLDTFSDNRQDDSFKLEFLKRYRTDGGEPNILGTSPENQSYHRAQSSSQNIDDAIELLNNFELAKAKELFVSLSKENPRLKIFIIECDLLVLSLTGFKELVDKCLVELGHLSNELGQVVTSCKLNANLHFENEITKAECILLRGLLNAILNNKWQAFLCLSESWRTVHRLEVLLNHKKINPVLSHEVHHRVLFAIGAFNLAFSLVPSGLLKLLKIIGITPNKELGLSYLQKCWNAKFTRSVYAALLVCCYHLEFELEPQKACEVVENGLVQFGRFPLFSWVGAILSWRFTQVKTLSLTFYKYNIIFLLASRCRGSGG